MNGRRATDQLRWDHWHSAWTPHIWLGCSFGGWIRILLSHNVRFRWSRLPTVVLITLAAILNSILATLQRCFFARRFTQVSIEHSPIFIIGHWRTGTTFLHELLSLDERHTYANNYSCFFPWHFLLTEEIASPFFSLFVPRHRPMDEMPITWERPQEDEFALCNLGFPSPYRWMVFPTGFGQDDWRVDQLSGRERARWEKSYVYFLRALTVRESKRLVLKSPVHSFRAEILLKLFPDARFIHIIRDPLAVFPSTMHMWKAMCRTQALQEPNFDGLQEHVLATFEHLHECVSKLRTVVAPNRFCEVRYEDLVADPMFQLRHIYESLELGEFEKVLCSRIADYLSACAEYQPNFHYVDRKTQDMVSQRWLPLIKAQGYMV